MIIRSNPAHKLNKVGDDMSVQENNHRKHKRTKLRDGVVALSFNSVCKITDISPGGISLQCFGKGKIPEKWSIDILMKGSNLYIEQVPVKLAWNKKVQPITGSFFPTGKLIGAKFEALSKENQAIMANLITNNEGKPLATEGTLGLNHCI